MSKPGRGLVRPRCGRPILRERTMESKKAPTKRRAKKFQTETLPDWFSTGSEGNDALVLAVFVPPGACVSRETFRTSIQRKEHEMILRMLFLTCAVSACSFVVPAIAQTSEHNSDKITQPIPLDPSKCQQQADKTFCPSFTLTEPQFEAYQKKIGGMVKLAPPAITKGVAKGTLCPSYCVEIDGFCSCPKFIPPSVLGPAEFEALKEAAKIK